MTHKTPPFAFIATYDVLPGQHETFARLVEEYAAAVEAHEPRTHALTLSLEEENALFTHIQVLADSEAMEQHLGQIQLYLARAAGSVRIRTIDVYGAPGPRLQAALDNNAAAGASVHVHEGGGAGFGRAA